MPLVERVRRLIHPVLLLAPVQKVRVQRHQVQRHLAQRRLAQRRLAQSPLIPKVLIREAPGRRSGVSRAQIKLVISKPLPEVQARKAHPKAFRPRREA